MAAATGAPDGGRVKASPLARRIARENEIDLHALTGTGPGGRIVRADVQAAAGRRAAVGATSARGDAVIPQPADAGESAPSPRAGPAGVKTAKGETTEVELSRTQQTIARRMAESKATIPHFALQATSTCRSAWRCESS